VCSEIVAAITATELRRMLAPFLGPHPQLSRISARDWQAATQALNTVRRHNVQAAYARAERDRNAIQAVLSACNELRKLVRRIEAEEPTYATVDPELDPASINHLIWQADVTRHPRLSEWCDGLENELLPLLDPRRAMSGGHSLSHTAQWEKPAHVAWFVLAPVFTSLGRRVGRRAGSRFLDCLAAALARLGFAGVSARALERWSERYPAILPAEPDPPARER
jgi:hypothetical protein